MSKVLVDRELLAGLVSNDRETRLDAERRMYGVLANQPAEADGVERYDWTYDEMAESQDGNYVRHGDYDAVTAERDGLGFALQRTEQARAEWEENAELLEKQRDAADKAADTCRAERDQLRAEVERLRKDAARYQWLRGRLPGSAYRIAGVIYSEGGEGVDAAIEAAMAAKEA